MKIPECSECMALLENSPYTDEKIVGHCVQVARTAVRICALLEQSPCRLNADLVRAGALVHDIARKQPDHAARGARMIRDLGFFEVADIVAVHMDLTSVPEDPPTEPEIVYFADKLTVHDRRCLDVEGRFNEKLARFSHDPGAVAAIGRRLETVCTIRAKLSRCLNRDIMAALAR